MKGAVDGGIRVPHSPSRFRGYDKSKKKYSPEAARGFIFGEHVSKYMEQLQENEPEKYKKHFSQYLKHRVTPEKLEELLKKTHAAIRKNPEHHKKNNGKRRAGVKSLRRGKITLGQRKHRITAKLAALNDKKKRWKESCRCRCKVNPKNRNKEG